MCYLCLQPECDCLELLADDSLDAPRWPNRRPNAPKVVENQFALIRLQDCFYCGDEGGTVDHLVPVSLSGRHVLSNVVPCCRTCNSLKGTKTLEAFYEENALKRTK